MRDAGQEVSLYRGALPQATSASLAAQLDRAQADLKLSAAQLARREKLDATDVVSKEELDQARAHINVPYVVIGGMTPRNAAPRPSSLETEIEP